jgi:hypothetical protein
MSYKEVYDDWEYLFDISPAYDMTGGYGDQHDLKLMLNSPTKKQAETCLKIQIEYWFQVGPEDMRNDGFQYLVETYPRITDIMEKYYIDEPKW